MWSKASKSSGCNPKKAASLSVDELQALRDGVDALLANASAPVEVDQYGKPHNQKGFIEEKMINGCGPYQYLRYWDGNKHRSVYLGKSRKEKP